MFYQHYSLQLIITHIDNAEDFYVPGYGAMINLSLRRTLVLFVFMAADKNIFVSQRPTTAERFCFFEIYGCMRNKI
ncbi:hypothetical protein BH11BAC6_BH11BAC6_09880 [soil metagenome]